MTTVLFLIAARAATLATESSAAEANIDGFFIFWLVLNFQALRFMLCLDRRKRPAGTIIRNHLFEETANTAIIPRELAMLGCRGVRRK